MENKQKLEIEIPENIDLSRLYEAVWWACYKDDDSISPDERVFICSILLDLAKKRNPNKMKTNFVYLYYGKYYSDCTEIVKDLRNRNVDENNELSDDYLISEAISVGELFILND